MCRPIKSKMIIRNNMQDDDRFLIDSLPKTTTSNKATGAYPTTTTTTSQQQQQANTMVTGKINNCPSQQAQVPLTTLSSIHNYQQQDTSSQEQQFCQLYHKPKKMSSYIKDIKTNATITTTSAKRNRSRGMRINGDRLYYYFYHHHLTFAILLLLLLSPLLKTTLASTTTATILLLQQQQQTPMPPTAQPNFINSDNNNNAQAHSVTNITTISRNQQHTPNTNNNNDSDMNNNRQHQLAASAEQNQPIEQVAKAEALTSSESAPSIAATSTLQQPLQSSTKLFEVCKLQSITGQQLTNLSQIMFQPSDICSTWNKMSRTTIDSSTESSSSTYPWHSIEQLNLAHNNLTVLHDSSGMSHLTNLLELKITHNQLSRCEESSLFGLQQLQTLDLSHNKLMALPPKFFQPVKHTIKKLNLSFNSISVLVPTLFESINQLEYLDLSHNDITSHWINDRLFKNLTQLRYLDLSFNKLTVFSSPMTFSSLQQLETLSLQHNELRQVPETIQYLRYLSSLDLSQNFIHDITNASYLSNCHLLFNLNLESNLLENITRDAFSDLPALKVLNLANNRIHHLDQQAFDCK